VFVEATHVLPAEQAAGAPQARHESDVAMHV